MTREGGSLKLANVTKKLQDLLSITKLLTVFETFDSEDEALRSYKNYEQDELGDQREILCEEFS